MSDAIAKVLEARKRHGESQLLEDLTAALKRADKAEAEAAELRGVLAQVRSIVNFRRGGTP